MIPSPVDTDWTDPLRAAYRSQLPVLRKHEDHVTFDAEPSELCACHHTAGYRQSRLRDDEPPDSVDRRGRCTAPFISAHTTSAARTADGGYH